MPSWLEAMLSRHDLAWLDGAGWEQARAQASAGRDASNASDGNDGNSIAGALLHWQRGDMPLVVRRSEPDLPAGSVALGLPLPPGPAPAGAKVRAAFVIDHARIPRWRQPLTLAEARRAAPPAWQPAIDALLDDAGMLTPRVFGSLAMQALTGLAYLRPGSDLDVLIEVGDAGALSQAEALLRRHATCLPLDGEIVFPGGLAVAWKEWLQTGRDARVMAKSIDGVRLLTRAALLEQLGP